MKKELKLKVLADDGCSSGICPTLYQNDEGRLFIQGYKVSDEVSMNIPENEELVEISKELLANIVKQMKE